MSHFFIWKNVSTMHDDKNYYGANLCNRTDISIISIQYDNGNNTGLAYKEEDEEIFSVPIGASFMAWFESSKR